jgi:cyanophycin synthetase
VGIIAAVGDRRDEDIISLGQESAKIFDEIIIRQDKNTRGRPAEELIGLLTKGILLAKPNIKIMAIPKESEAIDYAIQNAQQGAFITVISDVIPDALEQVKRYKDIESGIEVDA